MTESPQQPRWHALCNPVTALSEHTLFAVCLSRFFGNRAHFIFCWYAINASLSLVFLLYRKILFKVYAFINLYYCKLQKIACPPVAWIACNRGIWMKVAFFGNVYLYIRTVDTAFPTAKKSPED